MMKMMMCHGRSRPACPHTLGPPAVGADSCSLPYWLSQLLPLLSQLTHLLSGCLPPISSRGVVTRGPSWLCSPAPHTSGWLRISGRGGRAGQQGAGVGRQQGRVGRAGTGRNGSHHQDPVQAGVALLHTSAGQQSTAVHTNAHSAGQGRHQPPTC
jgi:hypothetical protein